MALANSDLTDKLGVDDLATVSELADILGVFDVCGVYIPKPGGTSPGDHRVVSKNST